MKIEIVSVIRNTEAITNATGDNQARAIFTVKYRVRINKKLTMDSEEVLFASDELDAYQRAKQLIKDKHEPRRT
jgi:hypothetical protein